MRLNEVDVNSPEFAALISRSMEGSNGLPGSLNAKLRAFEMRYEKTTAEMLAEARAGRFEDTADYCRWFVLAQALGDG